LSPSEALAKGYFSKEMHKYTGSAYAVFDDVTPGYEEGALGAFDGIWVKVLDGSLATGDLSLLIPPIRTAGVITTAVLEKVRPDPVAVNGDAPFSPLADAGRDATWLDILALLIDDVAAAPGNSQRPISPGLAKRDAHRNRHRQAIKSGDEWYVRLTVESPEEELVDRGNVLGQLGDSQIGFDEHDLPELSPFSAPYLSIVFPHPDWGEQAGEYTSNFHPLTKGHDHDTWAFDVRSDDPRRAISLRWSGPVNILARSRLIDKATGTEIKPVKDGVYTFVMNGNRRSFSWEYNPARGK
jgi:hypothetical protein